MSSGRQIFAFFCSPHDRRAQNSGCDYTPQSFYTTRVNRLPKRDVRVTSDHPSISDMTSRRGERRKVPLAIIFVGRTEIVHMPIETIGASTSGCGGTTRRKQEIAERML